MSGRLWAAGVDDAGDWLLHVPVTHGDHPEWALLEAGFEALDAMGVEHGGDRLTLLYRARPLRAGVERPVRVAQPDPGLVLAPGEPVHQRQRIAAYALVRSARGLLLTEFSNRTNVAGRWGLPGGGLDRDEAPEAALHREIHEETGQRVQLVAFHRVVDAHWVGRAPDGRVEDYHAVRLVYLARCPDPTDPVVHDVGGTTESAAWVPVAGLGAMPLVSVWRDVVDAWVAAGGR